METIRNWLEEAEFDWDNGKIVYQDTGDGYPGWSREGPRELIPHDHPILTKEFDAGYGGPECPRFVAQDLKAIYFPYQYDGATGIEKVFRDVDDYLRSPEVETPYPGG